MNQDIEEIPFTGFWWIFGAFIVLALLFPTLSYLESQGLIQEENPGPVWFNWAITIFLFLMTLFLYQFRLLRIEYKLGELLIGYSFFRSKILFNVIESVALDTSNPLLSYGGWGLRTRFYRGRFRIVYNMPGKRCVVVSLKNKKRDIVFSTNKPEYWIERLKQPI